VRNFARESKDDQQHLYPEQEWVRLLPLSLVRSTQSPDCKNAVEFAGGIFISIQDEASLCKQVEMDPLHTFD
jgi:hypothetical protein